MGKLAVAAMPWMKDALKALYTKRVSTKASERTWTEVTNAVIRHTKVLAERFCEISTVAFPQETTQIDKIYIPLKLQERNRPNHHEIDAFPSSLLTKVRKLLVVDAAGMGKSTVSRVIFLRALGEQKALPVFVDLRRLTGDTRIDDVLAAQFALKKKHEEQFFDFLRTQPILFLFDGFDEIAESEKIHVARMIRDFVDQNEKATFFVTSRPEIYFSNFTDFKKYSIKPLAKSEAHELIRKYGAAYEIEDRAKSLLEELRAKHDPAVSSFLENPLLTSLLFRAFEYKSVVPVKRGVFYRQVFDALYDAHDLNKETGFVRTKKTGLHQDDFHRVLRAMASMFRRRKVSEVTQDIFKEMAREVTATVCSDLTFAPDDLVHDCTSSVPLFARDGNHIRWSHKSLLDYFLSEFLTRDYTESKIEALKKVAFSGQSIADQNFLTLVHETDPTLFTEAVTIPAGAHCLRRYEGRFQGPRATQSVHRSRIGLA
ncbi:NACHT domain-containing protein [Luteibacter sp.]|jgi:hypothetical protein|uniref:NACHT domain-containing protein n=1 Tax=Luteibacter sp. TaxID=1886636 RepID=UPI002F41CED1